MNQEGENGSDGGNNAGEVDVYVLDEIHHPQLLLLILPQVCHTHTREQSCCVNMEDVCRQKASKRTARGGGVFYRCYWRVGADDLPATFSWKESSQAYILMSLMLFRISFVVRTRLSVICIVFHRNLLMILANKP